MTIKITKVCPLGKKCEEIVDNEIRRCAWYTRVAGQNPQTGEAIDQDECAVAWLPILLIENAKTNRGTASAVESFRNEMVKANMVPIQMIANSLLLAEGVEGQL